MSPVVTVGQGMAAGGDALGRLADGRVVLVEGALPGETVDVAIVSSRRDHAKARVIAVGRPASMRITPRCPHVAAGCGGCGWAHVDAAAQLELADRVVVDALARIGRQRPLPAIVRARQVDAAGYRTTVTMAAADGGRLAYHRRHGAGLIVVDSCRVAHPLVAELIDSVRAPGWGAVTLRVGVAGGERLVVVQRAPLEASGAGRARRAPSRRGGVVPPSASGRQAVVAPTGVEVVYPDQDAAVHEEVGGRRWRISARSFFQSGPAAAGLLVEAVDAAVGSALGAGGHLVDAYAGVGLLGGVVGQRRHARLTAVEADPAAAGVARRNLADLDATVVNSEVGRWAPLVASGAGRAPQPVDVVIADPARPGLGRPGVGTVAATGAARLVLVSCDPASLGRDTALLADAGYRLAEVEILGLFPDTVHFETVSRFERTASRPV